MAEPQFDPSKPFAVASVPEVTALAPGQERKFQSWAAANKITDVDAPESRYDYRGYWQDVAAKGGDQRKTYDDGPHFPDTYKQHGHPTFSIESKYSKGRNDGGRWDGETYVPQQAPAFDPAQPFTAEAPAAKPAGTWVDKPGLGQTWQPADGTPGVERPRADAGSAVTVDHDAVMHRIANWASTLHPSLQKPAAMIASLPADALASLVEMFSAPESVAAAGAKPAIAALDAAGPPAARALAAKALAAKNLASRVRVDPRTVADEFNLIQPLRVTKAVSLAPATPEMTAPGYDRYLPNTSGYVRPAAEVPAAAPAAVVDEFTAARSAKASAARQPGAGTLPDQKALNEAALAERRAAYQASQKGAPDPLPPAGPVVKESGKMQLTAPEMKEFSRLLKRGLSLEDSLTAVKSARQLAAQLGGATDAQVAAAVAHRAATGAW